MLSKRLCDKTQNVVVFVTHVTKTLLQHNFVYWAYFFLKFLLHSCKYLKMLLLIIVLNISSFESDHQFLILNSLSAKRLEKNITKLK